VACRFVQDPNDALVSGMPHAALAIVAKAMVCRAAELGTEVARLVKHRVRDPAPPAPSSDLIWETEMMEKAGTHTPVPGDPVAIRTAAAA
jgi:hypothetical protein